MMKRGRDAKTTASAAAANANPAVGIKATPQTAPPNKSVLKTPLANAGAGATAERSKTKPAKKGK